MTNPVAKPRWFHLTPDRLVLLLLVIEGLLWLSERFRLLSKGWTTVIAVAALGVLILLMLLWFAGALLFRWRFQFSIRSLLILVVVVAIPCSWLAVEMKKAKEQQEAVKAIRKAGAEVDYFYDRHDANGDELVGEELPRPVWLQAFVGKARVFQVCSQDFVHDTFAKITDAELEHVERLTDLRHLLLDKTLVTDAGLKHIEGLTKLEVLYLDNTQITDAGLEHIHDLPRLRFVTLDNTKVTGTGLRQMKGLPNLQDLSLDGTQVTDTALPYLAALPHLQDLSLSGTKVTDAGLRHLKSLTTLKTVRLNGTRITDAGLRCFEGMHHLEGLELNGTKVTDEGIKRLQRALPKCKIEYQWVYPPPHLDSHGHEVLNPALPDDDFDEAVRIAQAVFDRNRSDIVVGSSSRVGNPLASRHREGVHFFQSTDGDHSAR